MAQIVDNVYLHGKGIVHRDVKLMNVLLTEKYTVKVCDLEK